MVESSPNLRARPTSPHLQVWRWHITMTASILHRFAGMALYLGTLLLALWALSLAQGRGAFDAYTHLIGAWPGRVLLVAITLSVFFHLANGLRHLAWDLDKGFKIKTADLTALIAFIFAVAATAAFWWRLAALGVFAHD
jgi:succinate dehydrogenase / fumarate reductase cytochrome b subunit